MRKKQIHKECGREEEVWDYTCVGGGGGGDEGGDPAGWGGYCTCGVRITLSTAIHCASLASVIS